MKKFLIPAICILISFSFSGKYSSAPLPSPECGPAITIDNWTTYTVTKVEIRQVATGIVVNYNNPTFPIIAAPGLNGALKITYWFQGTHTGSIWWTETDGCQVNAFYNSGATFVNVFAGCDDYYLTIQEDPDFTCP